MSQTEIYFGPVPVDVARALQTRALQAYGPRPTGDQAEKWAWLDLKEIRIRAALLYVDLRVEATFDGQAIVSGQMSQSCGYSQPIGNWRPFAEKLRRHHIPYDFVRAVSHGEGRAHWDHDERVKSYVLERWRPGMRMPHVVNVDSSGMPYLTADQSARVARASHPRQALRKMLGKNLGRVTPRMVEVIENGSEVALALRCRVPTVRTAAPRDLDW